MGVSAQSPVCLQTPGHTRVQTEFRAIQFRVRQDVRKQFEQGTEKVLFQLEFCSKTGVSKYITEFKLAAANTTNAFIVNNLNFSFTDFCELVVSAKLVKKLYIWTSTIPLDNEFEFGQQLDVCNISYLSMLYCGNKDNGNWTLNPERFENLLEAISKCVPFKNSLKTFNINDCGVTKEKAEEIGKKYGLNDLKFDGV